MERLEEAWSAYQKKSERTLTQRIKTLEVQLKAATQEHTLVQTDRIARRRMDHIEAAIEAAIEAGSRDRCGMDTIDKEYGFHVGCKDDRRGGRCLPPAYSPPAPASVSETAVRGGHWFAPPN